MVSLRGEHFELGAMGIPKNNVISCEGLELGFDEFLGFASGQRISEQPASKKNADGNETGCNEAYVVELTHE